MAIKIITNDTQGVSYGGSISLSAYFVITSTRATYDGTTAPGRSQLVFTVTRAPKFPNVLRRGSTVLGNGSTFTYNELANGIVKYWHDKSNTDLYDSFDANIKDTVDGSTSGATLKIKISIPEVPPAGSVSALSVPKGEERPITKTNINFDDKNNPGVPGEVMFSIVKLPEHGKLLVNGSEITQLGVFAFTQDDINAGRVRYLHTDVMGDPIATKDSIVFFSNDPQNSAYANGASPVVVTLPITIVVVDKPLILVNNGPLKVVQGQKKVIPGAGGGSERLEATDPDTPTSRLSFTITSAPKEGTLFVKNSPWSTSNSTLLQTDIDAGLLRYEHDSTRTGTTDNFAFTVTDGVTVLTPSPYPITIEFPKNEPPVVSTTTLTPEQGEQDVADGDHISIKDKEDITGEAVKAFDIVIVKLPAHGEVLVNGSKAIVGTKLKFSAVLAGSLIYQHDGTDNLTDGFGIEVVDGSNRVPATVPVQVQAPNRPPEVTVNTGATVADKGFVEVNNSRLMFADTDSAAEAVFLTITALPKLGLLNVKGKPVSVGDKFSLKEWTNTILVYQHETTVEILADKPEDKFSFKLNDEKFTVGPFDFLIDLDAPVEVISPTLINTGMTMARKSAKAISETELSATHPKLSATELVFELKQSVSKGKLTFKGGELAVGDKFTVRDIMDKTISYENLDGTASEDTFDFQLVAGKSTLTGTFKISLKVGLVLVNNGVLQAKQGGEETIETKLLMAENKILNDSKLIVFKVITAPSEGTLVVNGARSDTFTQFDIDAGGLRYVHRKESTATEDQFVFSVTDGVETIADKQFKIEIIQGPKLVNETLSVPSLKCKAITSEYLFATSTTKNPQELMFTVVSIPLHGKLTKAGSDLSVEGTFTAQDITANLIQYCHTDEGQLSDSFDFSLTDGEVAIDGTFRISVVAPADPTLHSPGIRVETCTERGIIAAVLRVDNVPDSVARKDVTFVLNSLPDQGELFKSGIALSLGDTITQADIDAGVITYRHSSLKTGTTGFAFTWAAGRFGGDGTFPITIVEASNPPWLCLLKGITVEENETSTIDDSNLYICDTDLDATDGSQSSNPTPSGNV